jgi:hypothetical protein
MNKEIAFVNPVSDMLPEQDFPVPGGAVVPTNEYDVSDRVRHGLYKIADGDSLCLSRPQVRGRVLVAHMRHVPGVRFAVGILKGVAGLNARPAIHCPEFVYFFQYRVHASRF